MNTNYTASKKSWSIRDVDLFENQAEKRQKQEKEKEKPHREEKVSYIFPIICGHCRFSNGKRGQLSCLSFLTCCIIYCIVVF
jgi:hypothetical protein